MGGTGVQARAPLEQTWQGSSGTPLCLFCFPSESSLIHQHHTAVLCWTSLQLQVLTGTMIWTVLCVRTLKLQVTVENPCLYQTPARFSTKATQRLSLRPHRADTSNTVHSNTCLSNSVFGDEEVF